MRSRFSPGRGSFPFVRGASIAILGIPSSRVGNLGVLADSSYRRGPASRLPSVASFAPSRSAPVDTNHREGNQPQGSFFSPPPSLDPQPLLRFSPCCDVTTVPTGNKEFLLPSSLLEKKLPLPFSPGCDVTTVFLRWGRGAGLCSFVASFPSLPFRIASHRTRPFVPRKFVQRT